MSLYISSINSGSNGNCYYVGNDREAILVDAGISCREVEKRMKRLGLSMQLVKAIFVSHEHTDHISGIAAIVKKYRLPVYITPGTLVNGGMALDQQYVRYLVPFQPVFVGGICVTSFPKVHDAAEPHSFIVSGGGVTVGVFTDLGIPCAQLTKHFSLCHAAFLEANYDEEMLHNGRYPFFLKRRISGGQGHLSNRQALEVFLQHRSPFLSHLLLAHLSKDNNHPELVQRLFDAHAGSTQIIVASRYEETGVYHIRSIAGKVAVRPPSPVSVQYELF
jgi:phosphoribosyl 1,2-cyclic phosphodiesterase